MSCPLCPFAGTITQIRIHLRDTHDEVWLPCEDCDHRLIREDKLSVHFRNKHYCLKDCVVCESSFTQFNKCVEHEKFHHPLEMGLDVPAGYRPATNYEASMDELINEFGVDVSGCTRLPTGEYISFYDVSRKTPVVVVELLTRSSIANVYDERPPYEPDEALGDLQLTEEAVHHHHMDVSHLAAASCHRSSEEGYRSTFLWRNLIGLESSINRGPMSALELHQLALVPNCDKLFVITALHFDQGNVPLPSPGIGRMMKPDGVVKIMVRLYQNRRAIVDCFYVPNLMIPSQSIMRFRKTVQEVEALIGRQLLTGQGDIWRYVTDVEATRYRCPEYRCPFLCQLETELDQHYIDAHSHVKCRSCKRTFPTEEERDNHISEAHNFPCDQCDKTFQAEYYLKRHKAVHSNNKPFICTVCDATFRTNRELALHARTHDRKKLKCPLCPQMFRNNDNLTNHLIEVHHKLKDLPCEQVQPKVTVSSNGKMTTITKGRSRTTKRTIFTCPTCSKIFADRTRYNDHVASHSEDRPFACRFCGASFKSKKGVTRHEKENCPY